MEEEKRTLEETQHPKRKKDNKEIKKRKKLVKKAFLIILAIIVIFFVALIANDYIILDNHEKLNLVINNRNVTTNLKNDIIIENNIIYLSKADVANFFDKYLYEEKESNQLVTTYDKKIATIGFEENNIIINGSVKNIYAHAMEKENVIYLPISEMKDVYNIEIQNIEATNIITIDSLDREQKRAIVSSNLAVKSSTNLIAKTIDRVKKGDSVIVISSDKGYSKIRTANGKLGYVKTDKLENEYVVREAMIEEKQIEGKVNLTWDYFSTSSSAPNRNGTNIEGLNVISPAFFYLDKNGKFQENVGNNGIAYIEWAHNNDYKVWPMFSNAEAAKESLSVTSNILNSYQKGNS